MSDLRSDAPAAYRKGHGAMHKAGDEKTKHSGGPPKGYGSNGTRTAGSKKGRR